MIYYIRFLFKTLHDCITFSSHHKRSHAFSITPRRFHIFDYLFIIRSAIHAIDNISPLNGGLDVLHLCPTIRTLDLAEKYLYTQYPSVVRIPSDFVALDGTIPPTLHPLAACNTFFSLWSNQIYRCKVYTWRPRTLTMFSMPYEFAVRISFSWQ